MTAGKTIHEAFARAWESVNNPSLDSTNPHFKSRYASLFTTNDVVRKACEANGIEYMQTPDFIIDGGDTIEFIQTWVHNKEGDRIDLSRMILPPATNVQQTGSGITYIKRYLAQCDWFIVGEEDDDGNSAMPQQDAPRSKPVQAKRQAKKKVLFKDTRLFKECASLGVKPDGMERWYASKPFANKTIDELNDFEMGQVKAYLQEMKDSAQQVL
jgi:hypothetical protein